MNDFLHHSAKHLKICMPQTIFRSLWFCIVLDELNTLALMVILRQRNDWCKTKGARGVIKEAQDSLPAREA